MAFPRFTGEWGGLICLSCFRTGDKAGQAIEQITPESARILWSVRGGSLIDNVGQACAAAVQEVPAGRRTMRLFQTSSSPKISRVETRRLSRILVIDPR